MADDFWEQKRCGLTGDGGLSMNWLNDNIKVYGSLMVMSCIVIAETTIVGCRRFRIPKLVYSVSGT